MKWEVGGSPPQWVRKWERVAAERAVGAPELRGRAFAFACPIVRLHREIGVSDSMSACRAISSCARGRLSGRTWKKGRADTAAPTSSPSTRWLKEARETQYWLHLFAACDLVPPKRIAPLVNEANEVVAIITTIVRNAKRGGEGAKEESDQKQDAGSEQWELGRTAQPRPLAHFPLHRRCL